MILQAASFILSMVFLVIASYTDLKERIVPDKLNYAMIAAGIILHLAFSIIQSNYSIILYSLMATIATFAAGYLLWKLGVWAGGDVKLFTGMAALNPFNPNILATTGIISIPLLKTLNYPIFPLTLFLLSIISIIPVAVIISSKKILKQKNIGKKFFGLARKSIFPSILWGAFFAAASQIQATAIAMGFGAIVLAFLPRKILAVVTAIIFAAAAMNNFAQAAANTAIIAAIFFAVSLLAMAFSAVKKTLVEEKKITELKEGMIAGETIVEVKGRIKRIKPLVFGEMLSLAKQGKITEIIDKISPKGTAIVSHRKAMGLTEQEIEQLKELVRNKKLENHIMVKESTAFVPAVLAGYIAANVFGDIIWYISFLK